ncbi:senescence-induced receptor-like serine/threonine-protein kinase [Lolium perenne]|uniref:senescence-induced receptor-like serine/threonine-protein kinase n=1 Tax=Lolium perenne TaxID=4522 RepID=UPI0021F53009|nr:senescence-induced receptor-like serine/threonine-protein kinase [Lolium perenne]
MVISFSGSACTKLTCILALLVILVTTIQVHGQSASGFVSIDCGWTNSSDYVDNTLKLLYNSDGDFVSGGLNHEILPEFMAGVVNHQQKTLRSFPDGSRNCYTLPSKFSKKYLLRATFTYGNYDRLNKTLDGSLFLFGLHIGVNFWEAVNLSNSDPSNMIWKEVLTIAPSDSVSVCLINFGSGIPFISSLELRPLEDAMYPFVNTSVSINCFQRYRFGNTADFITRYPMDNYDRFWQSWSLTIDYSYPWFSLSTNNVVKSPPNNNAFSVPSDILQKASTLDKNYSFMSFSIAEGRNLTNNLQLFLPIFHFAEINDRNPNRRFSIYINNVLMFSDFSPSLFQVESKYYSGQFMENASSYVFLNRTPSSSLAPLINALEVYSPVRMENLTTDPNDVNYMERIKTHHNLARTSWKGDPCSPREYSWEDLTCDYSKGNQNPRIVTINLSTNGLTGVIALSFMNMLSLENLDLSNNNLTGAIPDYQLNSLKVLNLSNNHLDGPIPNSILRRSQAGLLDLRLEGNPLCSKFKGAYCSNKKKNTLTIVIVPVVLVSILVVMCILWKLYCKGKLGDHEDYAMYEEETPLHIDIRRFTYAELKLITNDFQSIIGKGGFGIVYHGILENGNEVAVKVLVETSIAESTDFLPEVQTLSKVHHKNLVTLEGYCQNKKCLALVYDFMPRGNLQQLLRGVHDYSLNWEQRLHIALDAAQGLEYLHESCTPSIVHRDVKTPNILLDKNLVGIISDFGLSRAFNDARTHISTVAAGTVGYVDPEYHATFQVTVKTDVYSFGIVLLEIITGQPPVFMDPQTVHLPNWVRQKIAKGSIHDIVDKRLLDQYDANSLQGVVDLAMNCVENAAIGRPTMTEVVSRLKALLPAVSSENQTVSATPRPGSPMDTEVRRQFQMMIYGANNEGSSSQSGHTGGMSEMSILSGR